jgi:hypothetical protein
MGGAVAARIAFWVISNRMFEDGLTTITHARNVVLGLGLVHHIGEGNVHGFTSALGVLIPLAGEVVKQGAGITAIRLASLAAVCIALLYARLICSDLGMRAFPTAFVLAYLAFDQNMIFYGMSGMETQVAVAILLGGVHHVRRNDLITSGIFLGLAPLVRPEFVLWVAPAFLYLGLRNRARVAKTVTVAAAVVIPWIVFTFLYYGSPIPNTIIAKATIGRIPPILSGGSLLPWTEWLAVKVVGHTELLLRYVEPFYENWSTVAARIVGLPPNFQVLASSRLSGTIRRLSDLLPAYRSLLRLVHATISRAIDDCRRPRAPASGVQSAKTLDHTRRRDLLASGLRRPSKARSVAASASATSCPAASASVLLRARWPR